MKTIYASIVPSAPSLSVRFGGLASVVDKEGGPGRAEISGEIVVAERGGARNENVEGFDSWSVPAAGRAINSATSRGVGAAQSTMVTTFANTGRRTAAEQAMMVVTGRANDPYAPWHAEKAEKANRAATDSGGIDRVSGAQVAVHDGAQAVTRSNERDDGRNER